MFVKAGQDTWTARLDKEEAYVRRELAEADDSADRGYWMAALGDIAEARRHHARGRG